MAKRAKTRAVRRGATTSYSKPQQMSLRTRRIIYISMAVVIIFMMLIAAAPGLLGPGAT